MTPRESLAAELATPLNQIESAIGGAPWHPPTKPTPDISAAMAIWESLAFVMSNSHAPRPSVVVRWRADQRAAARRWGEREVVRKVLGRIGRDSFAAPKCLQRYVERWEMAEEVPA